jgi:putative ABC transport system ATP-binding protein
MVLKGASKKESDARAAEVLDSVGLGHRLHHLPNQLSGGQQQRVAIARALVNSPSVTLADEPTGNLDSKTGEEVIALLSRLQRERNVTIITATHDVKMLAISDRIAWIRDGKLDRLEERKNVTFSKQ